MLPDLLKANIFLDKLLLYDLYSLTMERYSLGPNGGIVTSLNLFATRFDQVKFITDPDNILNKLLIQIKVILNVIKHIFIKPSQTERKVGIKRYIPVYAV